MGTKWLQHSFIYELANNLVRSSEHLCHMSVSKPCTILDLANEYDVKEWKKNLKIFFAFENGWMFSSSITDDDDDDDESVTPIVTN